MAKLGISYKRAPSEELLQLLMPGSDLSWLVKLNEEKEVEGQKHDVHFRNIQTKEGNIIRVYRGGTGLIDLKFVITKGKVDVGADKKYEEKWSGKGLFCRHKVGCIGKKQFRKNVDHYLDFVDINPSRIGQEGAIQASWSRVKTPWVPFDREANLAYESEEYKKRFKHFPKVNEACKELRAINNADKNELEKPPRPKSRNKVDQLAVDSEGHLVLLELKDSSAKSAPSVYYAPFQLLQYVWEWHKALQCESVRADLQKLIDTRNMLKLSPQPIPKFKGGMRAAIGFGSFFPNTDNKRQRGYKYKKVLDIVNKHLPPGIPSIQTWYWPEDSPDQLPWQWIQRG